MSNSTHDAIDSRLQGDVRRRNAVTSAIVGMEDVRIMRHAGSYASPTQERYYSRIGDASRDRLMRVLGKYAYIIGADSYHTYHSVPSPRW